MRPLATRQIVDATVVGRPALVPEIRLRLAPAAMNFETFRNTQPFAGAPTPFWAKTWPGGQALARYILDHPEVVAGRNVIDLGGGSGIAAIAAGLAGAAGSTSIDRDANAALVAALNAELNGVLLSTRCCEIEALEVAAGDLLLAGDLWYEQLEARRVTAWLRRFAARPATVLCGDCRRSHFPRSGLTQLATYAALDLDTGEAFERTDWGVWLLQASETSLQRPALKRCPL